MLPQGIAARLAARVAKGDPGAMRYLFVMPRFTTNFGEPYTFALGVTYVSAAMKQAGFHVRALNLNNDPRPVAEVLEEAIRDGAIDVLGTGGLSAHYHQVDTIVRLARQIQPSIRTVIGGGLVSSEPEVVMGGIGADFGVVGEGEEAMVELARALEAGAPLDAVDGILYREDGQLRFTRSRAPIRDINDLPRPDFEGFGLGAYFDLVFGPDPGSGNRAMPIAGSRSCPYACTFCYHPTGRKYRQRSLDAMLREMEYLVEHYHVRYFSIQDELFSVDRKRAFEFCDRVRDLGVSWDIQVRVDLIEPELLDRLRTSGCRFLSLGLESAHDGILKSMKKHITLVQIERALELVHQHDIEIQGNFIFGDRLETLETATWTLEWWRRHPHYMISIFFIQVYPGTDLYLDACRRGLIQDRLQFIKDGCPTLNVTALSDAEFAALHDLVDHYRDTYQFTPEAVRLLEPDGAGSCSLEMTCRKCRKPSFQPKVWIFATTMVACPHCRQRQHVEPFRSLGARHEPLFQELLAQGRKLAIWGGGNTANALFRCTEALHGADIPVIDTNFSKQGRQVQGHPISGPEVLQNREIDTILIASVKYVHEIAERIRANHGNGRLLVQLTYGTDANGEPAPALTEV